MRLVGSENNIELRSTTEAHVFDVGAGRERDGDIAEALYYLVENHFA